jgi:acyl carrier protein
MISPETLLIQQRLADYLSHHADVCEKCDVTTDLIENGILDSLLVTDLVLFAQSAFGIELAARDISPENFSSIERMADLVRGKLVKSNRAA